MTGRSPRKERATRVVPVVVRRRRDRCRAIVALLLALLLAFASGASLSISPATAAEVVQVVAVAEVMAPPSSATPGAASVDERQRILDQIDTVGRRGFLYEVTRAASDADDPGRHFYLYGTIHLGRVGSEPFNPAVMEALRQSRRLALEADPTDAATTQALALQLGCYGDGDDLQRHLSAALMARVRAFGDRNGLAAGQLARFKPWLLANMVTLRAFGDAGLDPALGSELYLSGYARARGMPIVEIEGLASQLHMLADLPDAVQAAQLDEALRELDDHSAEAREAADESRALFALWLDGDRRAGDTLVAGLHRNAAGKPFGRYFVETLIDRRNRTMADAAERLGTLPDTTFFAVGALHLFGGAGLIAEFERRGYRVVDLQAASTGTR